MNLEDLVNFCLIPDTTGLFNALHYGGYPGATNAVLRDLGISTFTEVSTPPPPMMKDMVATFINRFISDDCLVNETLYNIYNGKVYEVNPHILMPKEFRLAEIIDTFSGDADVATVLLKVALCRVLGHRVDNVLFIFPSVQKFVEFDITGWDHVPLLSYLYSNFSQFPHTLSTTPVPPPKKVAAVAAVAVTEPPQEEGGEYHDCMGFTISNEGSVYSSVTAHDVKYLQIFISGNTNTKVKITDLDYKNTKSYITETFRKLFIHAPYTINLSDITDDDFVVAALGRQLTAGVKLGASGVVIHVGKPGKKYTTELGLDNMRKNVVNASKYATPECKLLIETPAGQGTELLTDIDDLFAFWYNLPDACKLVVAICVDTCHVFACGYNPDEYLQEMLVRNCPVELIHFNDSQEPKNSRVDRHAHPGKGYIGNNLIKTLKIIKKHNIPAVLES
jgi:deoxyribonuclease-4